MSQYQYNPNYPQVQAIPVNPYDQGQQNPNQMPVGLVQGNFI